jgi:hypothetical protein
LWSRVVGVAHDVRFANRARFGYGLVANLRSWYCVLARLMLSSAVCGVGHGARLAIATVVSEVS